MAKIIIKRNADKFCTKSEVRQLGKAGRLLRMFDKSNGKANSKPKGDYKHIRTEIGFTTVELGYKPITTGNKTAYTVHAKEKRVFGCKELIFI